MTTNMRRVGRAWDWVSIYIPIILMALLAAATYWLARSTPGAPSIGVHRIPTHEPDYFLRGFSVKTFDPSGRLKSELHGMEGRHYPDTDTTEIDQPRIRSFSDKGVLTIATARKGISNGDGSQVQLIGDAVVTREAKDAKGQPQPKLEIRGEFLQAWMNEERIRSHKPVTLTRGGDVFNADSMDFDNLERVLELKGRVHGVLQPRGGAGAPAAPAPQ